MALLGATVLSCGSGCGDEAVSYSGPVGIELKVESDKVANDTIATEKSITTETGNPYGDFINEAQQALGRDPSRIELTSVEILLGASSEGVAELSEIFAGRVEILFEMNDTDDTFPVAAVELDSDAAGRGPLELDADFVSDGMSNENYSKLLTGGFKVVLTAPTQPDFDDLAAKADVQVTLTLEAFE